MTVMLFLAYELGYWLNHYLSHRVPFLWEFHKVHHSATVLTPLTNFRVHPVYMCIFLNILAVFTGLASGVAEYAFGQTTHQYGLSENNIILVFFIYLYVHLQHTRALDLVHRMARPPVHEPGAPSDSSLAQSRSLQQEPGKLPGVYGTGCSEPCTFLRRNPRSSNSASSPIASMRTRSGASSSRRSAEPPCCSRR